ncbi:MAG: ExbD/TolR family protein [Nitrospinota bacterium]
MEQEEDFLLPLTPLIDVVFLLLIFFMVSSNFVDFSKYMEIDLPESKAGISLEKIKNIVIEVAKDQKVRLNGELYSVEELSEELLKLRGTRKEMPEIFIRADKNLPYGDVVTVKGICQELKFTEIGVAVK